MTADKVVMIADDDCEERHKIAVTIRKISEDMDVTEVGKLRNAMVILMNGKHFDDIIINFAMLGAH